MVKEFSDNVQRLFDETVQDRSVQARQSAADLLDVLHRKVTQPIQVFKDNSSVRTIYYNVSVTMANDLSSMDIAYNSDYQMTFHDLTSCHLQQLSEFILALERDIPKWRHIWVADDKLRKEKAKIGERLVFAVTAARKVDDALYTRLAGEVMSLGFTEPPAAEMRAYLWDRRRYIKAAAELPAREVGAMIAFLASDAEAKDRLVKSIPELCYTAVSEMVDQFGDDPACRAAIGEMMRQPKAPPTLTTLLVGHYEKYREWKELPPLMTLLSHAIALGEGRQSGETLKMQNLVRRLFADKNWLPKVFGWLSQEDKALFFERFQASIAWDPSTHHATVMRMTRIEPSLEAHLVKVETKREYARVTSYRSYGLR